MAKRKPKKHKDVEFCVERADRRMLSDRCFDSSQEAAVTAIAMAASGGEVYLDVIVWSAAGARWWGGDEAVERYEEDPDASVFERYEIRVNPVGRIP